MTSRGPGGEISTRLPMPVVHEQWDELADAIERAWRTGFREIPLMAMVVIAQIRWRGDS